MPALRGFGRSHDMEELRIFATVKIFPKIGVKYNEREESEHLQVTDQNV